ncbi:MAG: T9SS type A sorting domain-containing protein [Paludibacter sp.]|nr:T9SS type A sorting domain-containing protein [Paludibacter sp.]
MKVIYALLILFCFNVGLYSQWTHELTVTNTVRNKTALVRVWHGTDSIRGFLLSGSVGNGKKFCEKPYLRDTLTKYKLGIIYLSTQNLGISVFDSKLDADFLNYCLDTAAKATGMNEFKYGPFILFGHSTDGLFCQNVAVWNPQKTFGILHYKSGNLGNLKNMKAPYLTLDSLINIPFLAINGRYEQYGPNGPFPGCSEPYKSTCYREVQWQSSRDTIMKYRSKGYPMSMIVDYFGDATHDSWSDQSGIYMSNFIAAAARIKLPPNYYPKKAPTKLLRVVESSGCLSDNDISQLIDSENLKFFPIEDYYYRVEPSIRASMFWHADKNLAVDWASYHHLIWEYKIPKGPVSLTTTSSSQGQITVAWIDKASNETGYILERRTGNTTFSTYKTLESNTKQFVDTDLKMDSTYYYRVMAFNSVGFSVFSNVGSVNMSLTAINDVSNKNPYIYLYNNTLTSNCSSALIESVEIYSVTGQKLMHNNINANQFSVPLNDYKAGVYIAIIKIQKKVYTKKFVIL